MSNYAAFPARLFLALHPPQRAEQPQAARPWSDSDTRRASALRAVFIQSFPNFYQETPFVKTYLVGGAVRDALLGRTVRERDWVVLGENPDTMQARGFLQVGKSFPVFLHPQSGEEYALARHETKQAPGHRGFIFSPANSLEEDLRRRDITINAIAMDAEGRIIDPYHGRADLAGRVLRHISPAFGEDPLRVFRIARFAAELGFHIAEETRIIMQQMARSGELSCLSAERVWGESVKALRSDQPWRFWQTLADCAALDPWFSELKPYHWRAHSEISHRPSGILSATCKLSNTIEARFVALLLDAQVCQPQSLCQRLKVPRDVQQLADLHTLIPELLILPTDPKAVFALYKRSDALRRPQRFMQLLIIAKAVAAAHQEATIFHHWWWETLHDLRKIKFGDCLQPDVDIQKQVYQLYCAAIMRRLPIKI